MIQDERLMKNYLVGAISAFEELYRRHRAKVLQLTERWVGQADAEKVTERVFFKFHKLRHRYESRYLVTQWLFVITRLEVMDYLKKENKFRTEDWEESIEPIPGATRSAPGDFKNEMESQLNSLSERQTQHLHMRFIDGLAFEEIAEILRTTPKTLWQRLRGAHD